jgi:RimJ/RimL family protein N-acetyltransferase
LITGRPAGGGCEDATRRPAASRLWLAPYVASTRDKASSHSSGSPGYDPPMSTRLETVRLVVRTFEARDADAWVAMFNDPKVTRFIPGRVQLSRRFTSSLRSGT